MPCYKPLKGYRARSTTPNGKRKLVFNRREGYEDRPVEVPCGRCIGCRLERSRQWAVRCMHEASLHEDNCFITLTYDDDHLPHGGTLVKHHWQDFMKRLRHEFPARQIKFYMCGEYGDESDRPHYHACLFNCSFDDRLFYSSRNGNDLYISPRLSKVWGKGFCSVGELTFESAAYTARYVLKKVTGERAADHYKSVCPVTGEIYDLEPEFNLMSRGGRNGHGIAKGWIERWRDDVYPDDTVIVNGREARPPRYYDSQIEETELALIKSRRRRAAALYAEHQTPDRLETREKVAKARAGNFRRTI